METKIVYFIAYYGEHHFWWDDDKKRFVPAGMRLYRTTWDDLGEALKAIHRVKHDYATGWANDIYIDSELTVA